MANGLDKSNLTEGYVDHSFTSHASSSRPKVTFAVGGAESPQMARKSTADLNDLQRSISISVETNDSANLGKKEEIDGVEKDKDSGLHLKIPPIVTRFMDNNDDSGENAVSNANSRHLLSVPSVDSETRHPLTPHEVLVELFDLDLRNEATGDGEWIETARWIKYEEDAEGVNLHWGQPHVAFLSFHSLIQLRKCITKGAILLDLPCATFEDACGVMTRAMFDQGMDDVNMNRLFTMLHMKHRHVREHRRLRRMQTSANLEQRSSYFTAADRSSLNAQRSFNVASSVQHSIIREDPNGEESPMLSPPYINETGPNNRDITTTSSANRNNNNKSGGLRQQSTVPSSLLLSPGHHPSIPEQQQQQQKNQRYESGSASRKKSSLAHLLTSALSRTGSTFSGNNSDLLQYNADDVLRMLPEGSEAAQVFVGSVPDLKKARFVMIRLAQARLIPELMEAHVPIRFFFLIVGPPLPDIDYHELGRAIATLMSNSKFHRFAYEASERNVLIEAIDQFLDDSVVIPPGEVDSKRLLSGDEIKKALKKRKRRRQQLDTTVKADENEPQLAPIQTTASRRRSSSVRSSTATGTSSSGKKVWLFNKKRLFDGVKRDLAARLPFYLSDFYDAANFQCLTTVVFMFFASFAPAITFGGLLGTYTEEKLGTTETLLAQCICGVIWGLFSAQPLIVMSATGPVLIFEASLFTFCQSLGLDFLTIRLYAGVWLLLIAVITVALEGSALLVYVTRFTEDIFAVLISAIFIAESVKFVFQTFRKHPVADLSYYATMFDSCSLNEREWQLDAGAVSPSPPSTFSHKNQTKNETVLCILKNQPDTGLLTFMLTLSTFAIAYLLKELRQSYYLGRHLRRAIGDFGVLIAIAVVGLTVHLFLPTAFVQRLDMPDTFGFTNPVSRGHSLLVSMNLDGQKWWGAIFALVPALLVYILLFVETEITELLLLKRERCLAKGGSFHWDLLLVGICALLCSVLGLPWMCAAAVQSLAHCNALTVLHRHAPGQTPTVNYVIEQRVTTIGVALLVGLMAFGGRYLKLPLAALFGVFLYLGVVNLSGVQLIQRIVLFFIPEKYFPDQDYCQNVDLWRMHLFTSIQIVCLVLIYTVKYFMQSAMAFPFILMLFVILRQLVLPRIFATNELKALDGQEESEDEDWMDKDFYDHAPIPV